MTLALLLLLTPTWGAPRTDVYPDVGLRVTSICSTGEPWRVHVIAERRVRVVRASMFAPGRAPKVAYVWLPAPHVKVWIKYRPWDGLDKLASITTDDQGRGFWGCPDNFGDLLAMPPTPAGASWRSRERVPAVYREAQVVP